VAIEAPDLKHVHACATSKHLRAQTKQQTHTCSHERRHYSVRIAYVNLMAQWMQLTSSESLRALLLHEQWWNGGAVIDLEEFMHRDSKSGTQFHMYANM